MDAPQAYKNAGIANLVGGVLTMFASMAFGLTFLMLCIGVGYIIPFIGGAWQAYAGWQMYNGTADGNAKTATIVGLVSSIFCMNLIAIVGGAFAFMQFNDPEVAGWIEANG